MATKDRQKLLATKRRARIKEGRLLPQDTPSVTPDYKEPLTKVEEVYKEGFGWLGTVTYDESLEFIQCHICGYFVKRLGLHSYREHGIDTKAYKEKFGLSSKAMVAPNTRKKYQKRWDGMSSTEKLEALCNLKKGVDAASKVDQSDRKKSLEQRNLEGSCPDQLIDKIIVLHKELGYTPSKREFKEKYGNGFLGAVELIYGGWLEAVREVAGLEPKKRGQARRYTEDELLEELRRFKRLHNREPMTKDMEDGLIRSQSTYRKYFGTFMKAKQVAFEGEVSDDK